MITFIGNFTSKLYKSRSLRETVHFKPQKLVWCGETLIFQITMRKNFYRSICPSLRPLCDPQVCSLLSHRYCAFSCFVQVLYCGKMQNKVFTTARLCLLLGMMLVCMYRIHHAFCGHRVVYAPNEKHTTPFPSRLEG